jgi:uncharacterized protein YdhG (YjbR/CyaY superfamily)
MSGSTKFSTVKEYFAFQPVKVQKALMELRECIYEVEPNATELLNYNIPAYALVKSGKRDYQIMIAGYKNHIGFYPHPTVIEKFKAAIAIYKSGKGSIQFPVDKALPKQLIKDMLKYRVEAIKKASLE